LAQEQASYIKAIEATAAATAERLAPPVQVNTKSEHMGANAGIAGEGGPAAAWGQRSGSWEQHQDAGGDPGPAVGAAGQFGGPALQVCAPTQHLSAPVSGLEVAEVRNQSFRNDGSLLGNMPRAV
jgi:hypothetical protein